MPHERIYGENGTPDNAMNAQIAWGHPSSPSDTGPGHGNDEGHVMIIVEHPAAPARTASSIEEMERRLGELMVYIREHDYAEGGEPQPDDVLIGNIIRDWGGDLQYAFGGELTLLAVQIDRKGCNRAISALRRGRDAAFGKDE